MRLSLFVAVTSSLVGLVHGHGAITAVKGNNGVTSAAFGIDQSTPRNGSKAKPFQQDTSIIRDFEIASGKASACGRTKLGGVNDIAKNLEAASAAGLPSADANGEIQMTLHQINQDGGGPYKCDVNTDGSGQNFVPMKVTTNVPGFLGFSAAKATDFPLVAKLPAGTKCTGGPAGNACIVRCRNNTPAGPFGGCVAATTSDAGGVAGNATAAGAGASDDEAAAVAAEAAEAAQDGGNGAANKLNNLGDILGAFGAGGAGADGGAGAGTGGAKAGGRLASIFGGGGLKSIFGGNRGGDRKRVVQSRIVSRELAGQWI